MASSATPWFYHRTLSQHFAQDLIAARRADVITAAHSLWLQRLVDEQSSAPDEALQSLPRIDRLLAAQVGSSQSELDCAWLISDPANTEATVFLYTPLKGIEAFADRQSLNRAVIQRFMPQQAGTTLIEAERVDGNPFTCLMQQVLKQQVGHLDALSTQLDSLPSLRTALGKHLQQAVPDSNIDVFSHLLQLQAPDNNGASEAIGTQTLADAALQRFGNYSAGTPDPVRRVFMDASGTLLTDEQGKPWEAAITQAGEGLASSYERLLDDYWQAPRTNDQSVRHFAATALAESFRQALLQERATHTLPAQALRVLGTLAGAGSVDSEAYRVWQPSLVLSGPAAPKLAGVFAVEIVDPPLPGYYLFSALDGLRHFADRPQLEEHFQRADNLATCLRLTSLDEHQSLREQRVLRVRLDLIDKPLFNKMIDSIIALQKRNLQHVLGLSAIDPLRAVVRVDDALDIRHLLDRRLAGLHDTWRWSAGQEDFAQHWAPGQTVTQFVAEQLDQALYDPAKSWHGQLGTLDLVLERLCELDQHAAGCLRQTLNRYLAMRSGSALDARDLWVHSGGTRVRLISLVMERISGHATGVLPADALLLSSASAVPEASGSLLPGDLLQDLLIQAQGEFAERYAQHLRQFFSRPLRWLDTQVRPATIRQRVLEAGLHLQLSMARRNKKQIPSGLNMLQQVLERPLRSLRAAMGEQRVEAHSLQLLYDPQQRALPVNEALVLNQASLPGQYVLWSSCSGISTHQTLASLEAYINECFASEDARPNWMSLLAQADRAALHAHLQTRQQALRLTVRTTRLDGHAWESLQHVTLERGSQEVSQVLDQARPRKLSADTLRYVLKRRECDDPLRQMLDRLGVGMEIMATEALLPQWMKDASIWQLMTLSAFIERWYIACNSGPDFLFDIAEPRDYARDKLLVRLAADYPGQKLDPDQITVTLTRYIPAPVATGSIPQGIPAATDQQRTSLTDFVIGRFGAVQDGTLSATLNDGQASRAVLSADYLRKLVRELDIANSYRLLLKTSFAAGQPGQATRLKYYTEQVPPLELMRTYAMRVRNDLSDEGFRFIEAILTMPDAALRLPVKERTIIISPLLLRAAPDLATDRVPGAFIIAPQQPQSGPWLLYTLFNADFHVQEYADEAALLQDVRTDAALQSFILSRLPEAARRLYANGGFMEPHIPFSTESNMDVPWETPKPVTLALAPVTGNALHALFYSTGEILQWWFAQLSVTNAEDDHLATTFLWSLGAEQTLALLPGRLGALVGLWQGKSLLHDSMADAVQMQWGKAAAELLAGVGVLLTLRRGKERSVAESEEPVRSSTEETRPVNPTFGWSNDSLTPELWSRLRAYQAQDLDLATLTKDPLVNTYQDPVSRLTYASVSGAMYRIEKDEYGWFIVGEHSQGPRVVLRDGLWQLNLRRGLRGGGGVVTRIKSGLVNSEVDAVLIVEARGMGEIRRKFRTHAQDIAYAHAQAREYLENCLDNLDHRAPGGDRHMRVTSIIKDFFDIAVPPDSLYDNVRHSINQLYAALMDGTLSPFNSQRYVVGVSRFNLEDATAFTFPVEPAKRIYLTERFFRDPVYRLKLNVQTHSRFNKGRHCRAAVLIHELSHLYCDTEDLAYLDAQVPFVDLLEDNSDYRRMVKNEAMTHQRALSWRTPRSELFRSLHSDGHWYDVEGNARSKIRQITGKHNLEDARDLFYSDETVRSKVILANADSVALLATLLGRERLVP